MRETPGEFRAALGRPYPGDDLRRYRYHTGAPLRPIEADEPCPLLFRDVGPVAMARFLRGELRRLAGPLSPILYMRTEAYVELYADPEQIGRLVFLRPLVLWPWHSGVPHVYVARATRTADALVVGVVPGEVSLADAARRLADVRDTAELREALDGRCYDEARAATLERLDRLAAELEESERYAEPLRRRLQSGDLREQEAARERMGRLGISEHDLCAAWHHLPRERRAFLREALAFSGDS
jgi:hypothetical protein